MKAIVYAAFLIIGVAASQCFAADICVLGKEVLLIQDERREEFFKKNIEGKVLEGKGAVTNLWQYGADKKYKISVACGNDVVANVAISGEVGDLKAGRQAAFEGTCISYGMRRYIYTKETYIVFEFEKGQIDLEPKGNVPEKSGPVTDKNSKSRPKAEALLQ